MNKEQLKSIAYEINTQDNRITADPLFCVFEKERIYGMDLNHSDYYVWLDDNNEEITIEELLTEYGLTEEQAEYSNEFDLQKVYYIDRKRFINAHFTEKAANEYICSNKHNLNHPFIYVTSYGAVMK